MASVVTTTSTLDITLIDSDSYETIFKIDNPRSAGAAITLAQIKAIYANVIDSENPANSILISRYGNPFTTVARAVKTETAISKTTIS